MQTHRAWLMPVVVATLFMSSACDDSNPTVPDTEEPRFSEAAQEDVEALIGGSMAGWWRAVHGFGPAPALSVAADAHTSSWRNWGMLHASQEPRQDLAGVEERFREYLGERPWMELYRTLVTIRDGMAALAEGAELGEDGADTQRALAFGRFMQGLALGALAQLFEEAWILDETTDPASVELSGYPEVMAAALERLGEAIHLAQEGDFTVPAEWVGFHRALDQDAFARLARSWRARLRISAARTPQEREAVDWNAVLDDVQGGITEDWAGFYDGTFQANWAWHALKLWGSHPTWARMDYRTIGPADASGAWQAWMAQAPADRMPFLIDTDDTRITGGSPTADGTYVGFQEDHFFRPDRGTYHFSFYTNARWLHLFEASGVGLYIDFPVKELDFIEAEARFRLGDRGGALELVNRWRANGGLPPFADAQGTAPGGDRCVPRRADGSCGDLWDALRYEKRLEVFQYGPFTAYLDSRGWGDLVEGTFLNLLQPDIPFPDVLAEIYEVGSSAAALRLAGSTDQEDLRRKREAVTRFDQARNQNPGSVGAG